MRKSVFARFPGRLKGMTLYVTWERKPVFSRIFWVYCNSARMPWVLRIEIGTQHDYMFSERYEPIFSYSRSIMNSCATLTLVNLRSCYREMCIAVRFCGSNVAISVVCARLLCVIFDTEARPRCRNVIWSTWTASRTESHGRGAPFSPQLWSPKMLLFGPYYAVRRVSRT